MMWVAFSWASLRMLWALGRFSILSSTAALVWLLTLVRLTCTESPILNWVFSGASSGISSLVTGKSRSSPWGREMTRISSSSFTASVSTSR